MKYYSTILKRLFDTVEELEKAEKDFAEKKAAEEAAAQQKAETRATRAKEIELARDEAAKIYKEYLKANKHYNDLVTAFVKDYGSYHLSVTNDSDWFDRMVATFFNW